MLPALKGPATEGSQQPTVTATDRAGNISAAARRRISDSSGDSLSLYCDGRRG